jgi:bleomycin hydrolase
MKNNLLLAVAVTCLLAANTQAQEETAKPEGYKFTMVKEIKSSPVDNQQRSGTCWSYSAIGLIESEMIRMGKEPVNLSEMYVVRKCYELKALTYIRMHGEYNFGGGGAVNDAFDIYRQYGMLPQEVYTGLNYGTDVHTHAEMDNVLKKYLDAVIENKNKQLSTAWFQGYEGILDAYLGKVPEKFQFGGKEYTPRTFADQVIGINPNDYVYFTSYTHHPFYKPFVLEVPDNWTWMPFYNIPIDEMMEMFDYSINQGYALVWASDISEKGFSSKNGIAIVPQDDIKEIAGEERLKWETMSKEEREKQLYAFTSAVPEKTITQEIRQKAFDNYLTTDDHGMVMTGIAKDQNGNKYYYIKNSWGTDYNDYGGFFYASDAFVRYKTMSVALNINAIPKEIKKKIGLK